MWKSNDEIRAVFFDVDNTLLDFDGYVKECMAVGFEKFGIGQYEESMYPVFHRINTGLWRQIETGDISFEELQEIRWNRIFQALGLEYDGPAFEAYFRDYLFSSAIPIQGALEILRYLRSTGRYHIYVASNGPHEQQVNRLRIAGMLPELDDVFTSEQLGVNKPDRAFFEKAFRMVNESLPEGERSLQPKDTVMIGDSLTSDMDGAIGFGMKTCWYTAVRGDVNSGERKIDRIIHELEELRAIL